MDHRCIQRVGRTEIQRKVRRSIVEGRGPRHLHRGEPMGAPSSAPEFLTIADNISVLDRFNAERNWVEMYLTR